MPPARHCCKRPSSLRRAAMARVLARAWPSSCRRFSSETPPSVKRSVGKRTSASVWPLRSKATHFTAPVLKSQPVITLSGGTQRKGSATVYSLLVVQLFIISSACSLYRAPVFASILYSPEIDRRARMLSSPRRGRRRSLPRGGADHSFTRSSHEHERRSQGIAHVYAKHDGNVPGRSLR